MEIRQIYYVLEVAKQKNFSNAAKALFITQPTISQQINSIETELQIKLFERDTHAVSLTKDGEKFCKYAKAVIDSVDDLMKAFDQNTLANKAIINIGVFPYYKTIGLSKVIASFYARNANIVGSMKVVENNEAYEMLKDGTINFAIIKSRINFLRADMHYDTLMTESLYAFVSKYNKTANKKTFYIHDLGKVPLLTGEEDSHYYNEMKDLFEDNNIPFNVAFTNTKNTDMIEEMVASDLGVSIASEAVAKSIKSKDIVTKEIIPKQELLTLLVYPKGKKLTGADIAFKNHILHSFIEPIE